MPKGALPKHRWQRTAQGWKRIPSRHHGVKPVPMPPRKRKVRKIRRIAEAVRRIKAEIGAMPENLAVEQGGAVSAPTPAAQGEKLTTRQQRPAWSGKYDALARKDRP